MFLKLVYKPSDYNEDLSERIIECNDVIVGYKSDPQPLQVFIDIIKEDLTIQQIEIVCGSTDIYIMSNEGKTIDSYRWHEIDGVVKRI